LCLGALGVSPDGAVSDGAAGVAGAGAGAAGAGATGSFAFEAGVCPPPVGTLSTYSFGAEVGSGLVGAGAVSVGVVGVVVVGVVVVWAGSGAVVVSDGVWPKAGTTMQALSAAATRTAHAECVIERDPFEPEATGPPARRHTMVCW
jgi:hypothetical protein